MPRQLEGAARSSMRSPSIARVWHNPRLVGHNKSKAARRDFLALQACQAFQGYLFGRPGPAEALQETG